MLYPWAITGGIACGLAFGYLGAGGAVVTLPFVLYLADMAPHVALGSKAIGVALIAGALLIWRLLRKDVRVRTGLALAVPGLAGIYAGMKVEHFIPGRMLVFLLGLLLLGVAGWVAYASTLGARSEGHHPRTTSNQPSLALLCSSGVGVGAVAGFFGIAGGFIVVPTIMLIGDMEIAEAAATAMLPITVFAAWIGLQYWRSGSADASFALAMLLPGILAGGLGIWLGQHVPRTLSQRIFAGFLVVLGVYMMMQR